MVHANQIGGSGQRDIAGWARPHRKYHAGTVIKLVHLSYSQLQIMRVCQLVEQLPVVPQCSMIVVVRMSPVASDIVEIHMRILVHVAHHSLRVFREPPHLEPAPDIFDGGVGGGARRGGSQGCGCGCSGGWSSAGSLVDDFLSEPPDMPCVALHHVLHRHFAVTVEHEHQRCEIRTLHFRLPDRENSRVTVGQVVGLQHTQAPVRLV
mmetsp:Transcript_9088/g.21751  ORF Transcript_9088/g.21751 Transcript_9088/m.21751 type:complete len:207 (-) Transcript_9088:429-1049(-)